MYSMIFTAVGPVTTAAGRLVKFQKAIEKNSKLTYNEHIFADVQLYTHVQA